MVRSIKSPQGMTGEIRARGIYAPKFNQADNEPLRRGTALAWKIRFEVAQACDEISTDRPE